MGQEQKAVHCNNYETRSKEQISYWKEERTEHWIIHFPRSDVPDFDGITGSLGGHKVEEHDDGTISVTPSILIKQPIKDGGTIEIHGFLTRGVWHDA